MFACFYYYVVQAVIFYSCYSEKRLTEACVIMLQNPMVCMNGLTVTVMVVSQSISQLRVQEHHLKTFIQNASLETELFDLTSIP